MKVFEAKEMTRTHFNHLLDELRLVIKKLKQLIDQKDVYIATPCILPAADSIALPPT